MKSKKETSPLAGKRACHLLRDLSCYFGATLFFLFGINLGSAGYINCLQSWNSHIAGDAMGPTICGMTCQVSTISRGIWTVFSAIRIRKK